MIKGKNKHGLKNPELYDALRTRGMSPLKAKKIANKAVRVNDNGKGQAEQGNSKGQASQEEQEE